MIDLADRYVRSAGLLRPIPGPLPAPHSSIHTYLPEEIRCGFLIMRETKFTADNKEPLSQTNAG
jgi:hypothetical protein